MEEGDLPILFEHQRDPEANRMAAFPARDREAFMAHWAANVLGDDSAVKKAIVVDGEVAGNVLAWGEPDHREVGYWIGREHWGRGVASRALRELLKHERTRPLFAHVAEHNVASIRVLQKCGFEVAGRRRIEHEGREIEELLLRLDR